MAALRDIARKYINELREGIAWVIVFRQGRSWGAEIVWSDLSPNGDGWETADLNMAMDILDLDPDAVILNGEYCGRFFCDMTIDHAAEAIRWHYTAQHFRVADELAVITAQEQTEAMAQQASQAGLPFAGLYDGSDIDLYVFDNSMSLGDYCTAYAARAAPGTG